jgi:hypothetical protein
MLWNNDYLIPLCIIPVKSQKCSDIEPAQKVIFTVHYRSTFVSAGMRDYDRHWCINLLNDLIKMPIARPFLRPVDPVADGAPDYATVVRRPMDFSMIATKLRSRNYASTSDFIADLKLIVSNAIQYNGEDSLIARFAIDLQKHFMWQFCCKPASATDEWFKELTHTVGRFEELTRSCPLSAH